MTNTDRILLAFQQFGYRITLGEALKHPWGYKLTSRISDLKKQGHPIQFIRGKTPSENAWVLTHFDRTTGQGSLI